MKAEEEFGSRERREREALESSDRLPRVTLAENTPTGWKFSLREFFRLMRYVAFASILVGSLYAIVSAQPEGSRACHPLFISGVQCGKLCTGSTGWNIRGCPPLSKLVPPVVLTGA